MKRSFEYLKNVILWASRHNKSWWKDMKFVIVNIFNAVFVAIPSVWTDDT